MSTLADRIRICMTLNGTRAQPELLARSANISHQHASRLLSGKCETKNFDLIERMSKKFHVSIPWLATGHGSPTPRIDLKPNEARLIDLYRQAPEETRDRVFRLLTGMTSASGNS